MLTQSPACNAFSPGSLDNTCRLSWIFMLPHPNYDPSQISQTLLCTTVPRDIRFELGSPPVCVCLGRDSVDGATVPEATVDEYGDLGTGEDDVGPAGNGRHVNAVTETHAMQFTSESALGLSARRSQRRHEAVDGWTRGRGS